MGEGVWGAIAPTFVQIWSLRSVAYPRGVRGGPDPPTFQKDGPRDLYKNAIKCVPQGGGGSGRSVRRWSSRFLNSKERMVLSKVWWSNVLGF